MKKPTVWICKEQMRRGTEGSSSMMDYLPAEQYGELRFITKADIPLISHSSTRQVWEDDVARFVEEYNPLTDFIITTGMPTAIFAIGHALGKTGKAPRFLVWRREDNHYRVVDGTPERHPVAINYR